jgi:hypothetical protein
MLMFNIAIALAQVQSHLLSETRVIDKNLDMGTYQINTSRLNATVVVGNNSGAASFESGVGVYGTGSLWGVYGAFNNSLYGMVGTGQAGGEFYNTVSSDIDKWGLYGRSTGGGAGRNIGVYGFTDNSFGYGVYGDSQWGFGVYGSGTYIGVVGNRSGSGSFSQPTGVFGTSDVYGVYGYGDDTGVYGAGPVHAGYFNGNVTVTENLSVENNICLNGDCRNTWPAGSGGGSAGWNASGGYVYLNNTGDSVGIGTTTPSQKLHVVGNATIVDSISIYGGNYNYANNASYPVSLAVGNGTRNFSIYANSSLIGIFSDVIASLAGSNPPPTAVSGRIVNSTGIEVVVGSLAQYAGSMGWAGVVARYQNVTASSSNKPNAFLATRDYGAYAQFNSSTYGFIGGYDGTGVYGTGTNYGVYGQTTTGTAGVVGNGSGVSASFASGVGVFGTGSVYGVVGGGGNGGVYGNGSSYGVYGETPPTGGYGVYGAGAVGVRGQYSPTVYGELGHVSGYGVYGRADSGNAGYFAGNVTVTGNLTVGTGTVFIDGTNSRIGIGTTSPSQRLHVTGNATVIDSVSIYGSNYNFMNNPAYPMRLSVGNGSNNFSAYFNASIGGVLSDIGVASPIDEVTSAIHGRVVDGSGSTVVRGKLAGYSAARGWYGLSVRYQNTTPMTEAYLATQDLAGYFVGNVNVTGNLTVGTGTVFIDGTNNRLGVGTASPQAALDVRLSSGGGLVIGNAGSSAEGDYAVAFGDNVNASGTYAFASGSSTNATGVGDTAMGYSTLASGGNSLAIGQYTKASGGLAFAAGEYTIADGFASTALGSGTNASGFRSTAMGAYSLAAGNDALAVGFYSNATGTRSIAMGTYPVAEADYSFAWGDDYCTGTNCVNNQQGVFAIYGGLCVAGASACNAVANGNIIYDGTNNNYDIAEGFPSAHQLEKGDVVVAIGDMEIGRTARPFDTRVVGIVSTSPNIVFNFDGASNEYSSIGGLTDFIIPEDLAPLTLAGRTPVKVTDENGAIAPGDLLTTSSKPGYAMKWSLVEFTGTETQKELAEKLNENERRRNSILGKALEPLDVEESKIMALVTLQ